MASCRACPVLRVSNDMTDQAKRADDTSTRRASQAGPPAQRAPSDSAALLRVLQLEADLRRIETERELGRSAF